MHTARTLPRISRIALSVLLLLAVAASLLTAAPAFAQVPGQATTTDGTVTSADGTQIAYTFFHPLSGGAAPVVMIGHLGANTRSRDLSDPLVVEFLERGYGILTHDERGWGGSGGTHSIGDPIVEGQDLNALLDMLAEREDVTQDGPGDPQVGWFALGGSATVAAAGTASAPRLDALIGDGMATSVRDVLRPNNVAQSGWNAIVCSAIPLTVIHGATNGQPVPRPNAEMARWCGETLSGGDHSPETEAWLAHRDVGTYINGRTEADGTRIPGFRTPTLILRGARSTLTSQPDAQRMFAALRRSPAPVKMVLFCGALGAETPVEEGEPCPQVNRFEQRGRFAYPEEILETVDTWLKAHVANQSVDTGPRIEVQTQDGEWHSARRATARRTITATASTTLVSIGTGDADTSVAGRTSGCPIRLTAACNEQWFPITGVPSGARLHGVGSATVTFSDATGLRSYAFIRIVEVDRSTGEAEVVNQQVTPVRADGASGPDGVTVTVPLMGTFWQTSPTAEYYLSITPTSTMFLGDELPGTVDVDVSVSIPYVKR